MIAYIIRLMNTYNFEQKTLNLGDSMVVILTIQKHVWGDPKYHIETIQMIYVENQLTCFYMSPDNTWRSL